MKKIVSLFILSFLSVSLFSQTFSVNDLWKLDRLSGSQISPNQQWIFYQVTSYDVSKNSGSTKSFLLNLTTNLTKEVSLGNGFNPIWTKQNSLIFLNEQKDLTEIIEINPLFPETNKVKATIKAIHLEGFIVSNDGKRLVSLEAVKVKNTAKDKYPDLPFANVRIEDDLMYRHWNHWESPEVSHLFWYELEGNSFVKKGDVMNGESYSSTLLPFGGLENVCFNKDGSVLYYATKKKNGKDFALSTNSEVYGFSFKDKITTTYSSAFSGYDQNPMLNFDGKKLAWLSMDNDGFESDKNRIQVMDIASRQIKDITLNLDLSVEQFVWSNEKDIIYFTAAVKGRKQLFSVELKSNKIQQLSSEKCDVVNLLVAKNQLIVERQSMTEPTDLFSFSLTSNTFLPITQINKTFLSKFDAPTSEEKWITTTDGKKMLVWVIYPPNYNPSLKYPALLYCQGGPQSAVSQYFSYRWNFRLMASQGYIIIAPNRRGLPGFGQEWNNQISKDWGGQAMNDYLVAVDSCVAQIPSINNDKIGAVGASYGGYSVYYLAGIHNNRFKTFVSHCGLFNLESWYGTTEELFFANWDQGGPYWKPENKSYYEKNSPHKLVDNWNTPMLVIHGGKDFRVPESEGMQAYQALQLKGIESKYLYFPEEGHWITKPQNGIVWYSEYFEWLGHYLK